MHTVLRFAGCLLLAALLAPAPVSLAKDKQSGPEQKAETAQPALRQFSAEELSVARKALADLTPEQRTLLNQLRYLLRPQYEEELMAGRAFSPCPLPPFEQPGTALEGPDVLRLWAVLASGMPVADSAKGWMGLFARAPIPAAGDSLGELGIQMAVCALGVRRTELGLEEELLDRAEELLEAAEDARETTAGNSPLVVNGVIDPRWYANQLWRALICRFALELDLNIRERAWERALSDLLDARDTELGWRSSTGKSAALDANLFAIAALNLAAHAPTDKFSKAVTRKIEEALLIAPAELKRLGADKADDSRVGSRLAVMLSLGADIAPKGVYPEDWRSALAQTALDSHEPDGAVREGAGRDLGLADGRYGLRVGETALACVALSGGLMGDKGPLSGLSMVDIGRAMHACSVLHANALPEGTRRISTGEGHDLPEPGAIESYMLEGIEYLVEIQHKDGGWGSSWAQAAGPGRKGQNTSTYDPGTTAFVALALMRAGHTPLSGEHKDAVLKATEYIVNVVDEAGEDGVRITEVTGTQLQGKLGQIVDTAVVTQFLARALLTTESNRALHTRIEAALNKCIRKIEAAQDKDGGWITAGWAPVLQSTMFTQALELAELAGCEVDKAALERSGAYLARDVEVEVEEGHSTSGTPAKPAASTSAGVAFYAGSSALRATAGDAAEVAIVMDRAIKDGTLPARSEVSSKNLRKIGYSIEQAAAKATACLQYETLIAKLEDEAYLKGFGNNGGEEFISYMLSSESIVITGNETWSKWNEKMHSLFEKIQNADGSWSGHHCISSPALCTAAVLMCLTADREVHVVVETAPAGKTPDKPKPDNKPDGPVTGK